MCNEKTCETCHGKQSVSSEIEGTETNHTVKAPCPGCYDAAEELKIKREFEREPGSFVSREG